MKYERRITATEANQRFSALLRDVEKGESFIITSRGRAVARVEPLSVKVDPAAKEAFLRHLDSLPVRVVGPWTRDELYD
jgi:prevent-host-death family protein